MAIYSCRVKVFSRSKGESATGAAAYRLGLNLTNEQTGERHDFSRRKDIEAAFTLVPENAPEGWDDPAKLWNEAEKSEKRKNSCIGREVLVALPAEMTAEQREALMRDIAGELVSHYGIAASVGIHSPDDGEKNFHGHILTSTRRLGPDGFGEKARELDDKKQGPEQIEQIRAMVADRTNRHLEMGGYEARVDHRTLEVQRQEALDRGDLDKSIELDRAPTRHEGRNPQVKGRVVQENEQIKQSNIEHQEQERAKWDAGIEKARIEGRLMAKSSDERPAEKARAEEAREDKERQRLELEEARRVQDELDARMVALSKQAQERAAEASEAAAAVYACETKAGGYQRRAAWKKTLADQDAKNVEDWGKKHPIRAAIGWKNSQVDKWQRDSQENDRKSKEALEKLVAEMKAKEQAEERRREADREARAAAAAAVESRAELLKAVQEVRGIKQRHSFENKTPEQQREIRDKLIAAAAMTWSPKTAQEKSDERQRSQHYRAQQGQEGPKRDHGLEL